MIAVVASLVAVVLLVLVVVALGMRSMNRRESALPADRLKKMAEQAEKATELSSDDFASREPRVDYFSPDFSPIDDEPKPKSANRQRGAARPGGGRPAGRPSPRRAQQNAARGRRGVDEWGESDDYDDDYWSRVRSDEGGFGGGTIAARYGAERPLEDEEEPGEPKAAPDPNAATVQAPLPTRSPASSGAPRATGSSDLADLVEPVRPAPPSPAAAAAEQKTVTFSAPTPEAPATPPSGRGPAAPASPPPAQGGTPRRTPAGPARRGSGGNSARRTGGRPEPRTGGRPDPRTAARPDQPSAPRPGSRPDPLNSPRGNARPDPLTAPRAEQRPDPLGTPRPASRPDPLAAAAPDPLTAPRPASRPDPLASRPAAARRDPLSDPLSDPLATGPYTARPSRAADPLDPAGSGLGSFPANPLAGGPMPATTSSGAMPAVPSSTGVPSAPLPTGGPVSTGPRGAEPVAPVTSLSSGQFAAPQAPGTGPFTPPAYSAADPLNTSEPQGYAWQGTADILDDPGAPASAASSGAWPAQPSPYQPPAPAAPVTPAATYDASYTAQSSYEVRSGWATIDDSDTVTGPTPAASTPTAPGKVVSAYDYPPPAGNDVLSGEAPGYSYDPARQPAPAPAAPGAWPEQQPAAGNGSWPTYGELYGTTAEAPRPVPDGSPSGGRGGHHRAPDPDYPDYYR
ncbi:hypothetical protein Misp01_28950 [Microtetraspora sp. NBRC 13810]|uniref:hypothetical protein n=1 Tax=Microtetraspora sp. NBRC 13810 TaxID=3030990 RepID=UPI0024A2A5EE|nr:hypothetical protein [Microtetraspora sp. NBRC 13810]GLW07765.1 hypothetical protein Misp01_28950 [Microtetraspora sp. NBRC 13810]